MELPSSTAQGNFARMKRPEIIKAIQIDNPELSPLPFLATAPGERASFSTINSSVENLTTSMRSMSFSEKQPDEPDWRSKTLWDMVDEQHEEDTLAAAEGRQAKQLHDFVPYQRYILAWATAYVTRAELALVEERAEKLVPVSAKRAKEIEGMMHPAYRNCVVPSGIGHIDTGNPNENKRLGQKRVKGSVPKKLMIPKTRSTLKLPQETILE